MRKISELICQSRKRADRAEGTELLPEQEYINKADGFKVNVLAMGDVGGTLVMGLRLLGGETVADIGIYDLNEKLLRRYEREINQIGYPDRRSMPKIEILTEDKLFECDVFVFCASLGVPPVGAAGDVRMAQLDANKKLVSQYAAKAAAEQFTGIFAVVSDPVDPLCKAAVRRGLGFTQVQGFGLGVMNARAAYYADRDNRFAAYGDEGRAYGPHGEDLVIADSITSYNDELSRELTELTVKSNLETRADGFKPYIAPALSSGAISILQMLRKEWNYSSVFLGDENSGAFLGCRNRRAEAGSIIIENRELDERLFERIKNAYDNLCVL